MCRVHLLFYPRQRRPNWKIRALITNLSMRSLLSLVIVSTLCLSCFGQMIYPGRCPKLPLQNNFNLKKYMGYWYEIGRTMTVSKLGKRCSSYEYHFLEEGTMIGIIAHATNFMDHKVSKVGKGVVDPGRPARLMVKTGKTPFWSNYNVLKTDYENYAVVWRCSNIAWILHSEILWILSRTPSLSGRSWTEINNFIREHKVRTRSFKMTKQSNCEFDFYS